MLTTKQANKQIASLEKGYSALNFKNRKDYTRSRKIEKEIELLRSLIMFLEFNPTQSQVEAERDKAQKRIDRIENPTEFDLWKSCNSSLVGELSTKGRNVKTYYQKLMGLATYQRHLINANLILNPNLSHA